MEKLLELLASAPALALHGLPTRRQTADEDLPLSFAQERFWILHQLEPLSPASNLSGVLHLAAR